MSENAENTSAMVLLIKRSIAFADWAAGEGISPAGYGDEECVSKNPEEFLLDYSEATGDEDWATIAGRITAAYEETRLSLSAKDAEIARLREALKPFADAARDADARSEARGFAPSFDEYVTSWAFSFGCMRAASAALQPTSGGAA